MKDYKKLEIFQKARQFNIEIYTQTKTFPDSERFGLTSQIRRSSISISANIAEGCGRGSDREFARFLSISYASACEVECLLILANDLQILKEDKFSNLYSKIEEIKKMIFGFIKRLRADLTEGKS
jgi:four helix bundle protein